MSLRSIGEGHTSSIEFRSGIVDADADVRLDPPSRYAITGGRRPHPHHKSLFAAKLSEMGVMNDVEAQVLSRLPDPFTIEQLEATIDALASEGVDRSMSGETTRLLHWVASSNYRVSFPDGDRAVGAGAVPERPDREPRDGGRAVRPVRRRRRRRSTYFATYTACDGHQILPQLLETADFVDFRVEHPERQGGAEQGHRHLPAPDPTAGSSRSVATTTSTTS